MLPMESVQELKQALSARARTASIEELRDQGRRRVRVIRAEQIAGMVDEAVRRALESSEHLTEEKIAEISQRSRDELRSLVAERQREAQEAQRDRELLGRTKAELGDLQTEHKAVLEQLEAARLQIEELESQLREAPAASAADALPPGIDLGQMMAELGRLKALVETGAGAQVPQAPPPQAPQSAAPLPDMAGQMAAALEGFAKSMDDRLEKLGRKMGISSAVEAGPVKLDALFNDLDNTEIESNLDTLEVKATKTGGIAANLAKLKKLKGGG